MDARNILGYSINFEFNTPNRSDGGIAENFDLTTKKLAITIGVKELFNNGVDASIAAGTIFRILYEKAKEMSLDYLQTLFINGIKIWAIDDGGCAITLLLPSEY